MAKHQIKDIFSALASYGKAILLSRKPFPKGKIKETPLIILANGPSLRQVLDRDLERLAAYDKLAVNFAANSPDYIRMHPRYYVLADGHFFTGGEKDPNVFRLWEQLRLTQWPMTLFVPCKYRDIARGLLGGEGKVAIACYNLTPAEGLPGLIFPLLKGGWGMPRPRNVLIPSIMISLRLGYREIYICGADHTWTRTLSVDEQNRVVSVQPHFYKDSRGEQTRVDTEYAGLHLHDVLGSMTVAFRSYHQIQAYSAKIGARLFNSTPDSMIDAFERHPLP